MSFASGLKTIVVATDLSSRSEAALEYARKLATAYGARIVLAHGIDPLEYAEVDKVPGQVLTGLTEEARAALDKLSGDLLQEGIHSHSEIRQGAVAQMLLDVARQYEAGLIVIGTKGMEGAGPVIVGAIAEQLVRLAPCPVLAVAADWNAGAFRPTPGGPVLLAMERNEAAAAAAATACSLAQIFQRPLLVLHART
ncbi:MAG: universal stress protein [Terracidiphilus sp.]